MTSRRPTPPKSPASSSPTHDTKTPRRDFPSWPRPRADHPDAALGVRLRPFGITRLVHQPSDRLPPGIANQVYALELHRDHLRGSLALGEALDRIDAHVARHVVHGADHISIVTDPDHARQLAAHVADLLDAGD